VNSSGKIVIIGILTVALASAATSWWFRYAATHRAAEFLGPSSARLIRDAPQALLCEISPPVASTFLANLDNEPDDFLDLATRRDISGARGLTHLRHALLEDRSYRWPMSPAQPDVRWQWAMLFSDAAESEEVVLFFTSDWSLTTTLERRGKIISCQPIAAGLRTMIGEITAESAPSP
jgi:hypothetical protein